jgi:hypothetical protein
VIRIIKQAILNFPPTDRSSEALALRATIDRDMKAKGLQPGS